MATCSARKQVLGKSLLFQPTQDREGVGDAGVEEEDSQEDEKLKDKRKSENWCALRVDSTRLS